MAKFDFQLNGNGDMPVFIEMFRDAIKPKGPGHWLDGPGVSLDVISNYFTLTALIVETDKEIGQVKEDIETVAQEYGKTVEGLKVTVY